MGKPLYEEDFFEWTATSAALLRAGRFGEADIDHIAEEIEDMGKSERRALTSKFKVLLTHLLKWKCQPVRRGPSWKHTIDVHREDVIDLLDEMPSVRRHLNERLAKLYAAAVREASFETGFEVSAFPETCPFTLEQILDLEFYPD